MGKNEIGSQDAVALSGVVSLAACQRTRNLPSAECTYHRMILHLVRARLASRGAPPGARPPRGLARIRTAKAPFLAGRVGNFSRPAGSSRSVQSAAHKDSFAPMALALSDARVVSQVPVLVVSKSHEA